MPEPVFIDEERLPEPCVSRRSPLSPRRAARMHWQLTQEAFQRLLHWFSPDREEAGRMYEQARVKLVRFFIWGGCDKRGSTGMIARGVQIMNIGKATTRRLTKRTYLRVSRLSFALLALGLVASLGRAQTAIGEDVHGQLAGSESTLRPSLDFKLHRGYLIVVSGSVGGLKNLHFLIDTGASKSVAARRLVERLGAHQHLGTLDVGGETVGVGQAVLTDLRSGPLSAKFLSVFALDLAHVETALGTHIDIVIGLDLLGQKSFSIDYETKRIILGRPPDLPLKLPMQSEPPLVSVTALVDGQPLRLLVSTGVPALFLKAPNAEADTREVKVDRADLGINVAGGLFVCRRASVQSVRLGEVELGSQPAFLVAQWRSEFDGSLPIPGRFKEVAFDFEHHLLGLRR